MNHLTQQRYCIFFQDNIPTTLLVLIKKGPLWLMDAMQPLHHPCMFFKFILLMDNFI